MIVQAFIPDWPGPKQHAVEINDVVSMRYPTKILNDPSDYFNAQWNKACQQFTGNILLWVMSDIKLPKNFFRMCDEMERLMAREDIGWYAPDVAWTSYIYDKESLPIVEPEVCEVPNTDSLLFAVRADVIKEMPFIDPGICFMWGMDVLASTTIRLMGLKMIRDYRFKAEHPNNTGLRYWKSEHRYGKAI